MQRGTLFLVVGPSGAGKDTLLDAARRHLEGDQRYCFPKRLITRAPDAGGEAHIAVSTQQFDMQRSGGQLLLHWSAHGQSYGIPSCAAEALAGGRHVVANVSRSVLDEARQCFQPVRILSVQVPAAVLRRRLQERGREQGEEVEERLQRASAFAVDGEDVTVIRNDGALETAVVRFVQALIR
jgi:ribose 1,5-bisphosphokinase